MSGDHRRCDNCKFWSRRPGTRGKANGECRRASPQAALAEKSGDHHWARWPSTWEDEWCGEIEVIKQPVF